MEFSARQIAEILHGEVEGNPDIKVSKVSKIEEGTTGTLSFLANLKYIPYLYSTNASIVIISKDFIVERKINSTLIRVDNAYTSFAKLLELYNQIKSQKKGIEQPSFISENVQLGADVYIGTFAYIGKNTQVGNNVKIYPQVYIGDNVTIKDNTTLFAGVKVYDDCIVGANCILHAGAIIGADGFGFAPHEGSYKKVPQVGNVVIEDNVEIGSNTTIDRATIGSTMIRKGVKLDNLIQIAHNVEIGENTVVAAQTGIAGSTKIGSQCMIGGQVGIVGHLTIANKVKIAAQSGVGVSIEQEGEVVQGSPAYKHSDYKKSYVSFKKLPELCEKIKALELKIAELNSIKNE